VTARLTVPDAVAQALAGERAAQRDLRAVCDGFACADHLLHSALDIAAETGIAVPTTPKLRSWFRALQKGFENGATR
jgi:hypothetical protein